MSGLFTRDNLDDFGRTFDRYVSFTGKTREEALKHTGKNFRFFLNREMISAAIPKGVITQERTAALKAGEGIKISRRSREIVYRKYGVNFVFKPGPGGIHSPSVTMGPKGSKFFFVGAADKKRGLTKKQQAEIENLNKKTGGGLTLQALLAKQEIKLREGHRMFTASSTRFKGQIERTTFSVSGIGSPLGRSQLKAEDQTSTLEFDWGAQIGKWSGQAATGLNSPSRRRLFAPALEKTRVDMNDYIYRKQQENGRKAARVL